MAVGLAGLILITHFASSGEREELEIVRRFKDLYHFPMDKSEEKLIPITAIYQYPIRGVRGTQVQSINITSTGPLNDRIWVLVRKRTMVPLDCKNSVIQSYLRQQFVPTQDGTAPKQVRVFLQNDNLPEHLRPEQLPQREIMLDIHKDCEGREVVDFCNPSEAPKTGP